ncbi:MAG TPA: hypothetical protein VMK16_15835 [Acidimicrobiales bacterium]|nr:hypothetical protein [Acidimicrobiales bacterium]
MSDVTTVVDAWLEAYAEEDTDRRMKLIHQAWSPEGRLVDPPLEGVGHAGLSEAADLVNTHYAGHTFRRTTGIDAHHEFVRYGWELVGPDGSVAVAGTDIGELAADGRLLRVTGFFGDLTAVS